MQRNR